MGERLTVNQMEVGPIPASPANAPMVQQKHKGLLSL